MGSVFAKILEMTLKVTIFDLLDLDHIGFIHLQLLFQLDKSDSAILSVPPEYYQRMPELKRQGELLLQDIKKIVEAPLQRDFRKGRRPSEKKPLPMEKQLAAFLLATKDKRESLRAVVCVWDYVLAILSGDLSRKQVAMADFVLPRRTKLLRKWRTEPRFAGLMEKFERGYTESLVSEIASIISRAPTRPLLESARGIYTVGRVIAPMQKRAHRSFLKQFVKRYETICKDDEQAAEALALAVTYALKPSLKPLADKNWSALLRREVDLSFSLQRDAVKALAVERNKKRRAAVASSLDGLMIVRQVVLMDGFSMIDHGKYGDKVIQVLKEKLRKSIREKAKKK